MADEYVDPSGNTEQFRAFVQRTEGAPVEKPGTSRMLVIGIVVAAVVVVVAVVAMLAL